MKANRTICSAGMGMFMLICVCTGSFGAEVFKSEDLKIDIGGNFQLMVIDQDEVDVADNGSRLHFGFGGPISESFQARGYFEWYVNTTASLDAKAFQYQGSNSVGLDDDRTNFLTNRLAYFDLSSESFGSFRFGKQFSVYQQTTGVTDIFNVYSAMASATYVYGDGGPSGTGRVDNAITWHKDIKAGSGTLSLGLQAQITDNTVTLCSGEETEGGGCAPGDENYVGELRGKGGEGARIAYTTDFGLTVSGSFVVNNLSGDIVAGQIVNLDDPAAAAFAASYKGDHLYAAATGSISDQMYQDDAGTPVDGWGVELALGYNLTPDSSSGSFMPLVGWNRAETDDADYQGDYLMDYLVFGLNWNAPKGNFFAFAEAMIDQGTLADGSDSEDDYFSVGMYYPF